MITRESRRVAANRPSATVRALLLDGYEEMERWNAPLPLGTPAVVTYSFSQPEAGETAYGGMLSGLRSFTTAERSRARAALAAWSAGTGLTFQETSAGTGNIRFAFARFSGTEFDDEAGNATAPNRMGGADEPSQIYLDSGFFSRYSLESGRGYQVLVHEIGHALGLKHPHESGNRLPTAIDTTETTVMSYTQRGGAVSAPRELDRQAISYLYGTRVSQSGITGGWSQRRGGLTRFGDARDNPVGGSSVADRLHGGDGNDHLVGYDGNDSLSGDGGQDTLVGGSGSDWLFAFGDGDLLDGAQDFGSSFFYLGESNTVSYRLASRGITVSLETFANGEEVDVGGLPYIGIQALQYGRQSGGNRTRRDVINVGACEILEGSSFADDLAAYGNQTVRGGDGADTLRNAAGQSNRFEGGLGNDTVVYAGVRAAWQIRTDGGTTTVQPVGGAGAEQDRLEGVETLRFDDRSLSLVADGRQGRRREQPAARLAADLAAAMVGEGACGRAAFSPAGVGAGSPGTHLAVMAAEGVMDRAGWLWWR